MSCTKCSTPKYYFPVHPCAQGNQLITQLNQMYTDFRDAQDQPHREHYYKQIFNHINQMIDWKKQHLQQKDAERHAQNEAALRQLSEDETRICNENNAADHAFDHPFATI